MVRLGGARQGVALERLRELGGRRALEEVAVGAEGEVGEQVVDRRVNQAVLLDQRLARELRRLDDGLEGGFGRAINGKQKMKTRKIR